MVQLHPGQVSGVSGDAAMRKQVGRTDELTAPGLFETGTIRPEQVRRRAVRSPLGNPSRSGLEGRAGRLGAWTASWWRWPVTRSPSPIRTR
jgi:hypothetical protein